MAMGFKPGAKQRVIPFAKGSESGDTELEVDSVTNRLRVNISRDQSLTDALPNRIAGIVNDDNGARPIAVYPFTFNTTSWDRFYGNYEITLLASATRNSTTTSPTQTNYNARGVIVVIKVTAVPGTDTITVYIDGHDPASNDWYVLLTGSALDTTGIRAYVVCPGAGSAVGDIDAVSSHPLPRKWRVRVVHSAATDFTYSVGASYVL